MPQPALHVSMARSLLERWRRSPAGAPFPLSDATANAFCHGALGPDMGLFPGGAREISDLVHTRAPARFAKALMARARNALEVAYAWGWVSHMLADIHIHPLINEAVAALPADSAGRSNPAVGHIMIESGLDAWFHRQRPGSPTRLRHAFGAGSAGVVARALDDVYDLDIGERQVLRLHQNVTRWYSPYLLLAGRIAEGHERMPLSRRGPLGAAGAVARRFVGPAASAIGFLESIAPAPHLVLRTVEAIARHDSDLLAHVACGLESMPDTNLETGERIVTRRMGAAA